MIRIGTLSWLGVGRERQVGTIDDTGATGTTDPILIIPDKFEGTAVTTYTDYLSGENLMIWSMQEMCSMQEMQEMRESRELQELR